MIILNTPSNNIDNYFSQQKKNIYNYFSKIIGNYLSNICGRLFVQYAQTTLAYALITAAHAIHHEIMAQASYLQHEQLE